LNSPLAWLGSRSHAIYLIHWPMMNVVNEVTFRVMPQVDAVAVGFLTSLQILGFLALTAGLAELNYRLIEQPLRRRGIARARQWLARQVVAK
jgi:peptidoglycan/LPS O-acetylase OafA/YrhL